MTNEIDVIKSRIPRKFQHLNHFFGDQLTLDDICRFAHLPISSFSKEPYYESVLSIATPPDESDILIIHQWDLSMKPCSMFLAGPVPEASLNSFIGPGYIAQRMAIISIMDDSVSINLFHLLHGNVSVNDPVHGVIADERRR